MRAEYTAKKGVCILTCDYLESKACCKEWAAIGSGKRIVVAVDSEANMRRVAPNFNGFKSFNGGPLMHVNHRHQMISASKFSIADMAKMIRQEL